jgi:predicted TIM-barrel fold metal-dependent hydrolase
MGSARLGLRGIPVAEPEPHFDVHLHLSRWWPDLPRTGYRAGIDYTVPGLLREMDEAGIATGLGLPVFEGPNADESLAESVANARASGGRLRPVATVDPTRGVEVIAAAVRLWGTVPDLAAVKLFPGYQSFYPHTPVLAPVYEFCAQRKIPLMIHQGDTLAPQGRIKYARPIEMDEVAVQYRDVRFVLCHLGNPWVEETAEIVYKNANVYTDTSGLLGHPNTPHFDRQFARAREVLQQLVDTIGATDRVLYGSDWPLESLPTAVRLIESLDLPPDDRAAILGGNARRLFGGGRP